MVNTMARRNNPRIVYGFGINDADYQVDRKITVNGKQVRFSGGVCPFYAKWAQMIRRCYDPAYHKHRPTYLGCSVDARWIYFSNFKLWMEAQDWEGMELDKDILVVGNKVYSPETCCFVPRLVNNFVAENQGIRGEWPIGVYQRGDTKKFVARCKDFNVGPKKYTPLGQFDCPNMAHKAWLAHKLRLAVQLSKTINNDKVAAALVERYQNWKT